MLAALLVLTGSAQAPANTQLPAGSVVPTDRQKSVARRVDILPLAGALLGTASATGWVPYLLLWGGLVLGALGGTMAYHALGTDALWGAASFAFALAVAAAGRGLAQR